MTVAREAIVLPVVFLTVAGLGGLRVGQTVLLLPPSLASLVLAVILVGTLVRAGVFAPQLLLSARRAPLENASGLTVLLTLFAASAQVFTLVTPDRGLLQAIFVVGFFVQLATTLAGVAGRRNLLRSLAVLLGAAFVLRFVVLEALYAPDGGFAKRLVTAMMEGASLGTLYYEPTGAATGYVAFFTLALFFVGIVLLPPPAPDVHLTIHGRPGPPAILPVVVLVLAGAGWGCAGSTAPARMDSRVPAGAAQVREDALAAARVWSAPATPVSQFDFAANPPGLFAASDEVACRFMIVEPSGTSPKFRCQLPDGRVFKVKYGAQNPELHAEVAGTRLLRALGFSSDDMFVVRAVHCAGCPRFPFQALECQQRIGLEWACFGGSIDYTRIRTFSAAVIERPFAGFPIEAVDDQGWAWYELDRIDAARGGSPRPEVDAFRLLAVLLAHWDNKGPNQRLVCPSAHVRPDGRCAAPVAMIQDLGATFGPNKVDLPNWRRAPIWRDRATCTVTMQTLPYAGATFPDRRISEAGRQLLAGLLEQLSPRQLTALFTSSRIVQHDGIDAASRDPAAWVQTFRDKVEAIRDGPPCPEP